MGKFCFIKNMKKFLTVVFFILIVIGVIFTGTMVMSNTKTNHIANSYSPIKVQQSSPTKSANPTKPQQSAEIIGTPAHISIPAIQVDADIEQVALDTQGNMD